jgi:amino acid transporter
MREVTTSPARKVLPSMPTAAQTSATASTATSATTTPLGSVEPPPRPVPRRPDAELPPDTLGYRLKRKVLGKPLHNEELEHERLGKPTALAVFASDNLSSSAYATEEILHVLVPVVGVAAFSLVMPITLALLVVLAFLILSYRETIKAYPSAGGAYLVTRDNFGHRWAQVAGASLLTDYVLTVAVSMSAGTAALVSAFDGLAPYRVPISLLFIAVVAFGNLRGVRESGRVFAVPTYFFVVNMAVLLITGVVRYLTGDLPVVGERLEGMVEFGHEGSGLLLGASAFIVLKAYASGGAAVTGVEAISNGVPAFRKPEWRNARQTLVIMGSLLGVMFLGLSFLASQIHVAPYHEGTPTVIAQIAEAVYGDSALGQVLFYGLQAGTMLILVLAANTGFADFPRLASFQAEDRFLPRQLTIRGHRLVYSNGVVALALAAAVLVVITGAEVTQLIPLYAVGVFTGFTLSQAGMTRHHLRERESGWRHGIVINGFGAVLSFVVLVVIATTKFADGAWLILVTLPVLVVVFLRMNRQYETEAEQLEHDVPAAVAAPILRRHVVLVFVDRLDLAAARAIQYARTLMPDELRAVHFVLDEQRAEELSAAWMHHGMSRIALDLVECPDRRLARSAVEVVAGDLADGETEVSVLLPDRKYNGLWHRILHDQTADRIERELSRLPHANVTTVPFHFVSAKVARGTGEVLEPAAAALATADDGRTPPVAGLQPGDGGTGAPAGSPGAGAGDVRTGPPGPAATGLVAEGVVPIASVRWRQRVQVEGRVRTLRVQPLAGATTLELVLEDDSGALSIVFLGRTRIPGIEVGTRLRATGIAGRHRGRLAILNPAYQLLAR